ncbi:MAG TPA: tRNA (adenosine(37)-N6)-threonylcarbamoyltransferase complex ATPase subunit type 1 TsaE [Thermoanaerobaculia bacterium]|nr:tRNA (adenosine(37)-N6)-threonylcarbamoyltransferase complex ATPase subunit type 1 TsaE [Thermoanaerobaculia bacterium]
MTEEAVTRNERETEELGRRVAGRLLPSDVVYLIGDLGAGKTCLARGVAVGLGASPREVASPSFALLHEYAASAEVERAGCGPVVRMRHLDLYRLKDSLRELEVLGLPGSVAGAPVVVEWPGEAITQFLPPTLEIRIAVLPDGARRIQIREGSQAS